jgi:hypothetical protein
VKGKTLYFDPGIPYVPFGKLRWDNVFTTALIVPKKGSPIWVRTPDGDPSENKTSRIAVVSLEGDALIGSLHVEFAGQTALKRRLDSHYDDESVKRHSIEEEAKKWFPEGSSVKLTNLTGLTSADSPIVADFELTVANVVSTSGSRALLPARIFETASNHPFSAQRRRHPVFLDFVYEIEDFAEVRLPGDVTVEALPAAVTKNAGAVGYVNEVTKRTSTLSLNRRLRFGSSFVTTDQYPLLRAFMSDVAIADQATISLQKR